MAKLLPAMAQCFHVLGILLEQHWQSGDVPGCMAKREDFVRATADEAAELVARLLKLANVRLHLEHPDYPSD